MEGLLCIKDIKILNKETHFISNLIDRLKKKIAVIWYTFFKYTKIILRINNYYVCMYFDAF